MAHVLCRKVYNSVCISQAQLYPWLPVDHFSHYNFFADTVVLKADVSQMSGGSLTRRHIESSSLTREELESHAPLQNSRFVIAIAT